MRRRILTSIVGVVILTTLILTIPFAFTVASRNRANAVLELERAGERTAAGLPADLDTLDPRIQLPPEEPDLDVAVYDRSGRLLAGTGPTTADAITARPGIRTSQGTDAGQLVLARPITIGDRRVATVRVAESTREASSSTRRDLVLILVVDLLAVAVAVGVGWVLASRLNRPLADVRDDAVRLGSGDFAITPRPSGVGEIDQTSQALAETAGRLDAVLQRERTFSANASHQLRTPVTSLRLAVESELAVPRDDTQQVLHDVLGDLDRLEATIDTLLAVARDLPRRAEVLDVATLASGLRSRWGPSLEAVERGLSVFDHSGGPLRMSVTIVEEILNVLVDNAHRHGLGDVAVVLTTDAENLLATVTDQGTITIDTSALFVRRQPGATHHGIGLALARSLAEAEGGRLVLVQTDPTAFRLILPSQL